MHAILEWGKFVTFKYHEGFFPIEGIPSHMRFWLLMAFKCCRFLPDLKKNMSQGLGELGPPETLAETIESGPLCITDLFQNKSVAYFQSIIIFLYFS